MEHGEARMKSRHGVSCLAMIALVLSVTAAAQRITAENVTYPHVNEDGRTDYIVYADAADYDGNTCTLAGVKVEFLGANESVVTGTVTTSACIYDRARAMIRGQGRIIFRSDLLGMQGVGFVFDLAKQRLSLTAEVTASIKAPLLPVPGTAVAGGAPEKTTTTVTSDHFDYWHERGVGVFRDKVRLEDREIAMDSDTLEFHLAGRPDGQNPAGLAGTVSEVSATGNVLIANRGDARLPFTEATCQKATYSAASGDLVLSHDVVVTGEQGRSHSTQVAVHLGTATSATGKE